MIKRINITNQEKSDREPGLEVRAGRRHRRLLRLRRLGRHLQPFPVQPRPRVLVLAVIRRVHVELIARDFDVPQVRFDHPEREQQTLREFRRVVALNRPADVEDEPREVIAARPQPVERDLTEIMHVDAALENPFAVSSREVPGLVHHERLPVPLPDRDADRPRQRGGAVRDHGHHLRLRPDLLLVRGIVQAVLVVPLRAKVSNHQPHGGVHLGRVAIVFLDLVPRLLAHATEYRDVVRRSVRADFLIVRPEDWIRRGVVRQTKVRDVHGRAPVHELADLAAEE
eukprot:31542-Pelagococcus_subviridis.AAC.22